MGFGLDGLLGHLTTRDFRNTRIFSKLAGFMKSRRRVIDILLWRVVCLGHGFKFKIIGGREPLTRSYRPKLYGENQHIPFRAPSKLGRQGDKMDKDDDHVGLFVPCVAPSSPFDVHSYGDCN